MQSSRVGRLQIACCRLAIRPPYDESPLQFSESGEVLALNGEIYNFPPVGTSFQNERATRVTDTALLSQALSENGEFILPSLRGLFALCFSDGRRVLLARDRFGIKPLYYAHFMGGLVFASEMKALLSLPNFSRDLDEDVISSIKVVGHNLFAEKTVFRRIRSLRPGHLIECFAGEELKERPFAIIRHVPMRNRGTKVEENVIVERTEELLEESISSTIRHDPQPKALFFSGGLDSSLLLEFARKHAPITCFTLSDRQEADDLLESRRVAQALAVPLEEVSIDEEDLAREIVSYAWHFEQPISGGAFDLLGGVAFHGLARRIGKEFKVALTGEGADELFLGYHRLHMRPEIFIQSMRDRIGSATPLVKEALEQRHFWDGGPSANQAVRDLAVHEGLSDYHLASVDRSGMAFGLEIRPPYLDNALAEWATSLDETELIDRENSWTKLPLRSVARKRFFQPGTERIAVRRKWAMPNAIQQCSERLNKRLNHFFYTVNEKSNLEELLMDLFSYLFVDPGFTSPPDFSFIDFVADLRRHRRAK
jgi:asparagine synthase (glutamine-hydrolysing)